MEGVQPQDGVIEVSSHTAVCASPSIANCRPSAARNRRISFFSHAVPFL